MTVVKLKMFRYEAIRKGECFRAYIRVPEEHYDDIVKILSKDYIYFGGSRGSGYGKCRVTGIKEVSAVCLYESDLDIKEDLYIYFYPMQYCITTVKLIHTYRKMN